MDENARAAFLIAQAACAMAEAAGMQAENQLCAHRNRPPDYREVDFQRIINKYGIGHNAALTWLGQG